MLQFEGERQLAMPPAALWPKLRDAGFLVACIPDATVTGVPTQDRATCSVRPGIAFVRGNLNVMIEIVDAVEPTTLRFLQTSKGIGSSSDVETVVTLTGHDGGTHLHWTAEVKRLGGLLKAVPSGLIRGAANKVIEDVWQGIEGKLQSSQP